jgi:RNA polymerase sigma-70 factor (ECF subfamily)
MSEKTAPVDRSDEEWLSAIADGDAAAESAMDRRWRARLEQYAYAIVRDRHLAEEAAQLTLWRVFLNVETFDHSRPFEPWLLTIARNVSLSLLRNRQREAAIPDVELLDAHPAPAEGARTALWLREALASLQHCVEQLNERSRTVVALYKANFALSEMGRMLDRPKSTVQSWLDAALEQLRRCMEQQGYDEGSSQLGNQALQAG